MSRHLTWGQLKQWMAGERDDCPIRVVVYTETGTVSGMASHASGSESSVGAVNIILDKQRGPTA